MLGLSACSYFSKSMDLDEEDVWGWVSELWKRLALPRFSDSLALFLVCTILLFKSIWCWPFFALGRGGFLNALKDWSLLSFSCWDFSSGCNSLPMLSLSFRNGRYSSSSPLLDLPFYGVILPPPYRTARSFLTRPILWETLSFCWLSWSMRR